MQILPAAPQSLNMGIPYFPMGYDMGKSWHSRPENREKWNAYKRRRNRELRNKVIKAIGNRCVFCGVEDKYIDTGKRLIGYLHFHEIHGKEHDIHMEYILKHTEDFAPLCPRCHRGVHWCTKYLLMTWDEILDYIQIRRDNVY